MGEIRTPEPVKLFAGILAANLDALSIAIEKLSETFGEIDIESEVMPFDFTDYYAEETGTDIKRKFVSFVRLIAPDEIAPIKRRTNELEGEIAAIPGLSFKRPANIDPGYLSLSKVVLATTKDHSHRLYLRDGIYAEVTLRFHKGDYEPFPWTYPDYRTEAYRAFFRKTREKYLKQLRGIEGASG